MVYYFTHASIVENDQIWLEPGQLFVRDISHHGDLQVDPPSSYYFLSLSVPFLSMKSPSLCLKYSKSSQHLGGLIVLYRLYFDRGNNVYAWEEGDHRVHTF